jgi:hypothetical protein
MAVVQVAELAEVIIDAGESAKSLNSLGIARLLALVDAGAVDIVNHCEVGPAHRSVKDLAELLARFTRRGVSLVRETGGLRRFARGNSDRNAVGPRGSSTQRKEIRNDRDGNQKAKIQRP